MTMLKAGDKVRFLNEVGGGVVTRVVDNKIVNVLSGDGFEIPVMITELVKADVLEDGSAETEEETIMSQRNAPIPFDEQSLNLVKGEYEKQPEINLIFAFVLPDAEFKWNRILTYLINDSNYESYYLLGYQSADKVKYVSSGLLESNTKVLIEEFNMEELFNYDYIVIQQILFNTNEFKQQSTIQKLINAKDLTVLKNRDFIENDYFDEPAFIIEMNPGDNLKEVKSIDKDDLSKMLEEKLMEKNEESPKVEQVKPDKQSDIEETDLHIHEIMDNYHDLSNSEILKIQLDRFETALEGAIINKTKRIVFIHGVGNGSLKFELRRTLDSKFPDLSYQDASFKEYGYGATMVDTGK